MLGTATVSEHFRAYERRMIIVVYTCLWLKIVSEHWIFISVHDRVNAGVIPGM